MKIKSRTDKYRFPYYFFSKEGPLTIKIISFLLVILVILFIIDTTGLTYRPKIKVDAYTVDNSISPDLYGYSIDSNFTNDQQLVNAVRSTGAETLRVMDEYEPGARMLVRVENGAYKVLASDNTPYEPDREYDLKIRVNNNNIRAYIDGQQIFNVNDSRFTKGSIGLTSSNNLNTYFDNVVVRNSNDTVIFSDNFSNNLNKWDNGDIPGFYDQGSWSSEGGMAKHTGKQSISLKHAGDNNWKNYTVEAKIKSNASNVYDIGYMGLVFRYNGVLNNYRFLWRSHMRQPYLTNNPWGIADFDGQLEFAQNADLKPNMVINMRDHSPKSAADLVREMNVNQDRGIEYWELGNEIWAWSDSYIHNTAYAAKIKEYSQAMKAVDPSIKIGASILLGFSDWDEEVIRRAAPYIDFIIVHYYPYFVQDNISDNHILASSYAFGNNYKSTNNEGVGLVENARSLIKRVAPGHENRIKIAITEFNTGDYSQGIDLIYGLNVADMLGYAGEQDIKLMQFHKLDNETGWQWGAFTQDYRPKPAALAIGMFSNHFGTKSLNTKVTDTPKFSVSEKNHVPSMNNVPYLTAYASRDNTNSKLYLMVVNKHSVADMNTTLTIDNAYLNNQAKAYTLSGSSIHSDNRYSNAVKITEKTINNASSSFSYNFPAHSVTAIEFNVDRLIKPLPQSDKNSKNYSSEKNTSDKNLNTNTSSSNTDTGNKTVKKPDNSDFSVPTDKILVSAGYGGNPHLRSFNEFGYLTGADFFAYDGNFRGGVSVAYGDIDGDGEEEIISGAGPGGGPHIRAFEKNGQEIANFFPFHPDFRGGIKVACGDIDRDGIDEIAVSQASNGQAWIKVYKNDWARTIVGEWNAFGDAESGADIAMGDIDNDGVDEIIVGAGPTGGPHVRVYEANGTPKSIDFFAFHPDYHGGLSVAAGDIDGDGKDEIGVAQSGQEEAWIKIVRNNSNQDVVSQWKAYGDQRIGANIAMGDINNDGKADMVTGTGLGGKPLILAFDLYGNRLPANFYVFDQAFIGGLDVDVAD